MIRCCILLMLSTPVLAADASVVLNVMICESGLKHDAVGDDGISVGIAQFRRETFFEFAKMAKAEMKKAKLWPPQYKNPQHQVFLLEWGLDNGYQNRWSCYRKLYGGEK